MELTQSIHLIAAAATLAVLIGFLCYRIGMASAHGILAGQLHRSRAVIEQLHSEVRAHKVLLEIERDDAEQQGIQLAAALHKQRDHQAQLEAIMQDADARVAAITRRTLSHAEGEQLHSISELLGLARATFQSLGAADKAELALTLSRNALNIASKAPAILANAQERAA